MVGYFAVLHAHDIDRLEMNLALRWRDAKERSFMRPVVGLVSRHTISIGKLPVDLRVEVRECQTKIGIELPNTRLVRSGSWLRCVVHEDVGEQFFEHLEVTITLDLFGNAADDRLRGIA